MDHDELPARVRELRAKGCSPKEIARALGIKPAVAATMVRAVAADDEANGATRAVECWVSPGWSGGLTVDGRPDWPDVDLAEDGSSGLVNVLVAHKERGSKLSLCGYLVDVYCLGVKDVIGPRVMNTRAAAEFSDAFFSRYPARPFSIPLALAQDLVLGAVDYARALGLEPAKDFDEARGHLEPWTGPSRIRFGREGIPFFIAGPYDDSTRILDTLDRSVGRENFQFLVGA